MKRVYKRIRIENLKKLPLTLFLAILNFVIFPLCLFCIWYIKTYIRVIVKNYVNFGRCLIFIFSPHSYKGLKNYNGIVEEEDLIKYKAEITNTPNFIAIKTATRFDIFPKIDVIWIYFSLDTQTLKTKFGSPISYYQKNSLVFATNKQIKYQTKVSTTNGVKFIQKIAPSTQLEIENDLRTLNPNLVVGYNIDLDKIYKSNVQKFIQIANQ